MMRVCSTAPPCHDHAVAWRHSRALMRRAMLDRAFGSSRACWLGETSVPKALRMMNARNQWQGSMALRQPARSAVSRTKVRLSIHLAVRPLASWEEPWSADCCHSFAHVSRSAVRRALGQSNCSLDWAVDSRPGGWHTSRSICVAVVQRRSSAEVAAWANALSRIPGWSPVSTPRKAGVHPRSHPLICNVLGQSTCRPVPSCGPRPWWRPLPCGSHRRQTVAMMSAFCFRSVETTASRFPPAGHQHVGPRRAKASCCCQRQSAVPRPRTQGQNGSALNVWAQPQGRMACASGGCAMPCCRDGDHRVDLPQSAGLIKRRLSPQT